MQWKKMLLSVALALFLCIACAQAQDRQNVYLQTQKQTIMSNRDTVVHTDAEWKEKLTDLQYRVTRQKGTEPAFSGKYNKHDEEGIYACICCGQSLFNASTKYDSGSGWPSFYAPVDKQHIKYIEDRNLGMVRTEVRCSRCDAHLGHVFDDGPKPTHQRYCVNSAALDFQKK